MTDSSTSPKTEVATLAGGCFWCLEAVFNRMTGVRQAISGYMGGQLAKPTYEQVCGGRTGHAEVVRIEFDPARVSYRDLLDVFFAIHDPTTLNRQGNDSGTQYRSAIFFHDDSQRDTARAYMDELERQHAFPDPIVTELVVLNTFYPAEPYHQDFFTNNPNQPYCQFVVAPKVTKFFKSFADKVKA